MKNFRLRSIYLFFLVISLAYFSGCSGGSQAPSAQAPKSRAEAKGIASVADQPSLENDSPKTPPSMRPPSWNDYLATLSEVDRSYLAELSIKYYGALIYSDPSELATLSRLGFPPLEKWIEARGKTDFELLNEAQKGGIARAFYTERVLEIFEKIQKETGKTIPYDLLSNFPENQKDELRTNLVDAQTQAIAFLRENPSPFSAYVYGRISAMATGSEIPILSSLALAEDLGDSRAKEYLRKNSEATAPVDGYSLLLDYRAARTIARK